MTNDSAPSYVQAGRDVDFVRQTALQLARCVLHLHEEHGVIHRDIKPKNVLVFGDGLKLADMDASSADGADTGDGKWSPTYAAPELARHKLCTGLTPAPLLATKKFDVWSLGVVMYELSTGIRLFVSDTDDHFVDEASMLQLVNWTSLDQRQLRKILSPEICPGATAQERGALRGLISRCLSADPAARPTVGRQPRTSQRHLGARPIKATTRPSPLDVRKDTHKHSCN